MTKIGKAELQSIVDGIVRDRETIIHHNPIGTNDEVLLWMLLSSLVLYLDLSEIETPCFTGKPDAATYLSAIKFVLKDRLADEFDPDPLLDKLSAE